MRNLGNMGEFAFANLCAEGGLVVNKSTTDVFGWDYLVEFPFDGKLNALNLHDSAIECKIQIKATDGDKKKVQVTVSSLRRLATAQMPAFFVFLDYDKKDTYQRVYLAHVDQDLIYRTLKKIRELENKGGLDRLNKATLVIKYNSINHIEPTNGLALKNEILKHIPKGMDAYISSKKSYLDRCGFEESAARMNITSNGIENMRDLVDVSLGLKKSASISKLTTYYSRFGIVDSSPSLDIIDGHLEMPDLKPASNGYIEFKTDRFSAGLKFDAEIYFSPFVAGLPKEQQKFRLVSKHMEMVFYPYANKFDYVFDNFDRGSASIFELRKYYELNYLLHSSGSKIMLEINFEDGRKLEFGANCHSNSDATKKIRDGLSDASKLLNYFDIFGDELVYSNDICENADSYAALYKFLNASPVNLKVRLSFNDGLPDVDELKVACVGIGVAPIGDKFLICIYVVAGISKIVEESFYLKADLLKIERKIVLSRREKFPSDDIYSLCEEIGGKYLNDYRVLYEYQGE